MKSGKRIRARTRRIRFKATSLMAGVAVVTAWLIAGTAPAASAASTCTLSTDPTISYTVNLCIDAPPAGTVTGSTTVTASATVTPIATAPASSVREMVFTLDGNDLLWDYQAPYTWTLDSTRWMDGTYTLAVSAIMRDGYTTGVTSESVTFSNGITTPPVNSNTFTPTAGTQPPSGQNLVVAAAGDGASGQTGEASTVNVISLWHPNLFLYLGDVYENGRPMEFNNWYGLPGTGGTYGQFYSITDPTIGNHEYVGSDISGYEWYWNNVPHYYSYDAGGWHFVSLDNITKFIGTSDTNLNYTKEIAWLQNDLNNNKQACTIAYYHEPLFNVGKEGSAKHTSGIWKILASHHVAIVLNGHDHDYQRWKPLDGNGNPSPTGVTEFIVGTGGHGHQSAVTTDSRLVTSDFTDLGALKLTLGPTGADYQFVNTLGTTVDSGTVACNQPSTTTLTQSVSRVRYGNESSDQLSVQVSPGTPAGTVAVTAASSTGRRLNVCTITLAAGNGSCYLGARRLRAGKYKVTASYGGNPPLLPSTSAAKALTVTKAKTTTSLRLSTARIRRRHQHRERFTVHVSPQYAGLVHGKVTVRAITSRGRRIKVCVITLKAGSGSCRLKAGQLRVGRYHIVARYRGSANYAASSSVRKALRITR